MGTLKWAISWSSALALNCPEWMLPCLHRRVSFPSQPYNALRAYEVNSEMQCSRKYPKLSGKSLLHGSAPITNE
jgi:hypothetical protein